MEFLNEVVSVVLSGKEVSLRSRPIGDPFHHAAELLNERLKDLHDQREHTRGETTVAMWALHEVLDGIVRGRLGAEALEVLKSGVEIVDQIALVMAALLRPSKSDSEDRPTRS